MKNTLYLLLVILCVHCTLNNKEQQLLGTWEGENPIDTPPVPPKPPRGWTEDYFIDTEQIEFRDSLFIWSDVSQKDTTSWRFHWYLEPLNTNSIIFKRVPLSKTKYIPNDWNILTLNNDSLVIERDKVDKSNTFILPYHRGNPQGEMDTIIFKKND